MRLHLRIVLSALVALVLLAAGALAAESISYRRAATTETEAGIIHRGCVIRFDTLSASGNSVVPRIHANSTHTCIGVTSVRADWTTHPGDLVLENAGGPTNVVAVHVTSDETLTERGITCGPSGGGQTTRLRCYDREGTFVPAYSLELYGPTTNLWVSWTMYVPPEV